MFAIDRLRRELTGLPGLVRVGLAVMVLGGFADVVAHLSAADHLGHAHEHTSAELQAHLAGFVGMVVVFVGVVADGVRRQWLRRSTEPPGKGVA